MLLLFVYELENVQMFIIQLNNLNLLLIHVDEWEHNDMAT